MPNSKSKSLIPIQSSKLAKVGDVLKITEKLLAQINYVPFLKKNGKYIFVNSINMKSFLETREYDWVSIFSEGLASVKLDGKYGFIDKTGREVVPMIYDSAGSFLEGLARVKLDDKFGFIDHTGKEVVSLIYDNDDIYFWEGLASVKLDGKWGFIDKAGTFVINPQYDRVESFRDGLAYVKSGEAWSYIDKSGKTIWPASKR